MEVLATMIQKVKLYQGQTLTKDNIMTYLNRARTGYDYFRIDMKGGMYITITFFRDNSFDIMTNSRNLSLWRDIEYVKRNRGITILGNLVFNWIRDYNR